MRRKNYSALSNFRSPNKGYPRFDTTKGNEICRQFQKLYCSKFNAKKTNEENPIPYVGKMK